MNLQSETMLELKSKKYIIEEEIDSGGNGTVWKAKINGDPLEYAIKVLKDDKDKDKEKLERFGRECQFCREIDNKHIVKIFDYVVEKGKAYCIMPYYSRNLRTIIDAEHDSFVLLDLVIQLCEAVQFIHHRGIVHRDIKPENYLLTMATHCY